MRRDTECSCLMQCTGCYRLCLCTFVKQAECKCALGVEKWWKCTCQVQNDYLERFEGKEQALK